MPVTLAAYSALTFFTNSLCEILRVLESYTIRYDRKV